MSEKLKGHLAKLGAEALEPLLGREVVELLLHVGQDATAPEVMADLIIGSHGPASVLRDRAIRKFLIEGLELAEITDLCAVLQLATSVPRLTLQHVNFDMPNRAAQFFEWFNVPYGEEGRLEEPSCNVVSAAKWRGHQEPAYRKLRALLEDRASRVLVHMPFGAGKLRAVVTAVLETLRSEETGKSVLWLAPDDCLCEEAMRELVAVWEQLGLRDVTAYRLFGRHSAIPTPDIANALVVANIGSLLDVMSDPAARTHALESLETFGAAVRHIVLADAETIGFEGTRQILAAMGRKGSWNLIGISATPPTAMSGRIDPAGLVSAYGHNIVAIDDADPLGALHREGTVDPIDVVELASPIRFPQPVDEQVALTPATIDLLADDPARNKVLLDRLHSLSHEGQRIAFYATTARQARMFRGLLALKGTGAVVVTSEMELTAQMQEVARFNANPQMQVLCMHGVLMSSEQVPGITAVVLAFPSQSGALLHEMVGRLATSRNAPHVPLHVYAVADPVPSYLRLVRNLHLWQGLEA